MSERSQILNALGSRDEQIAQGLIDLVPTDPPASPGSQARSADKLRSDFRKVRKAVEKAGAGVSGIETMLNALDGFAAGFNQLAKGLRARDVSAAEAARDASQRRLRQAADDLALAKSQLGLGG